MTVNFELDGHTFTAPVGSLRPNAFGLYDLHGNVATREKDLATGRVARAVWSPSAGATPARAACSNCTSHASPVGSATDSTAMPLASMKVGKMCLSKESLK